MLRYDQHPSRQRDAIAQRQAMLDTIVDYRFFAPARFAADELWQREMARVALSRETSRNVAAPWAWAAALRRRLGATLIEVGTRLQGNPVARFDPQPES
jgi:hypothetical protein